MSNAMDKIINSALDAVEEHVVQRLEDTGLVVFDDDDDTSKRTTLKGRNVVQKLKLMREEKKLRKETKEKKRKEKEETKAERKREDKASDAKLMEIVKKAQQQQQRETSDANDTTKEKDAVLVKALLKEVQRLRERVKTSYEEEENEGFESTSAGALVSQALEFFALAASSRPGLPSSSLPDVLAACLVAMRAPRAARAAWAARCWT